MVRKKKLWSWPFRNILFLIFFNKSPESLFGVYWQYFVFRVIVNLLYLLSVENRNPCERKSDKKDFGSNPVVKKSET